MEDEIKKLKHQIHDLKLSEIERKALEKENIELKNALSDQEDEIKRMIDKIDQLSESADQRQVV